MDLQAVKDEVSFILTGDIVGLELSDAAMTKVVNSALREIQRYIDTAALMTIPYESCIDMSQYKVNSVVKVMRAEGYYSANASDQSAVMDPLYASQWQVLSGMGNIANMTDYVYRLGAWNSILQIRNTTSTDLSYMYDKHSEKLYINISSNKPQKITIMYIPIFEDVSQIKSDFWIDALIRLAVALAKVAVGRARSKFKQSNAPWELDGATILQEGLTELKELRDELKASTQLCYGQD